MRKAFVLLLTFCWLGYLQAVEAAGIKVFISVDMEGISGVVHGDQTSAEGQDYGAARKWMAEDVNAVIAGLLESGVTEIVVNDSHGSMRNILPHDLSPKAQLISGSPKALSMMQGIDDSYHAVILVGYHAKAGTKASILDHTISGGTVYSIKVNGVELPELGLNALIAGYYNVPVVLLSGDQETCSQAKSLLGSELVTVAVKEGIQRTAAKLLPLEEARRLLKEGAKEAITKRGQVKPYKLNPPFRFEMDLMNSGQADYASVIPQVERTGARSVAFSATDFIEGFKLLRGLINLASTR